MKYHIELSQSYATMTLTSKMSGGQPMSAMAVESLRLLPPL